MNEIYDYVEAALPNIKGSVSSFSWSIFPDGESLYSFNSDSSPNRQTNWGSTARYISICLDASRSSSVYKDDCTTVQPSAYTVMYIMKIK